jgi:CheY-like chemotaxis protein
MKRVPEKLDALVVDDEPDLCELMEEIIGRMGLSVAAVSSSSEALQIARKTRIRVVVADYAMPDMDGLRLIRKIREQLPEIRSILITGDSDIEATRAGQETGDVHVLVKPIDLQYFEQLLAKLVS